MPPGRKNKRGYRGSTEESHEKSTAKSCNMADNGTIEAKNADDTSSSEQKEPDLLEIKSMLVDIQTSLSSILLENKQLPFNSAIKSSVTQRPNMTKQPKVTSN